MSPYNMTSILRRARKKSSQSICCFAGACGIFAASILMLGFGGQRPGLLLKNCNAVAIMSVYSDEYDFPNIVTWITFVDSNSETQDRKCPMVLQRILHHRLTLTSRAELLIQENPIRYQLIRGPVLDVKHEHRSALMRAVSHEIHVQPRWPKRWTNSRVDLWA